MDVFSAVVIYALMVVGCFLLVSLDNFIKKQKERYDWRGFDKNGIHKNGTLYNDEGYDRDGYNRDGYNRDGYNREGYNRLGYNKNGYDKYGYNVLGYNKDGFDRNGFDKDGYDYEGYNLYGVNKAGLHKFQTLQTSSTCEKIPQTFKQTTNLVDSKIDSKNVILYNISNEKQCIEEISVGLYLSDYERFIYPKENSDNAEDCEVEYDYVSVIYDDYNVCDFELGEDFSLPLTTNANYSYCTFEEKFKTTNNYHTHLDCFKYWENKNKNNFLKTNAWYLVDPIHIHNKRMKKCKICEKRDELSKDIF